ncbi:hypothetical protein [Luteolibacter luteus]|uniref:Uncharacterized protein n=1 Tax=Luteolibacter luteus TaxID=2728835 RepID=A0A858RMG2_9BACT|nr:hypothetical protein [Luteolibacter luteus]QJE97173.1 hypothetical protein HHL09_15725 [Luteolibacter luteus]
MPAAPTFCESCESALAQLEYHDAGTDLPYLLCGSCKDRLIARSLRPLEWYNLAKRHGWTGYLIHDDFYEEDGEALQPMTEVEDASDLPVPHLKDVAGDPRRLLEYSVTRWDFDAKLQKAWRTHPPDKILEEVRRHTQAPVSRAVRETCLDVMTFCVKGNAGDFVRESWQVEGLGLHSLVAASAACMPFTDAFERTTKSLAAMPDAERAKSISVLIHFQNPKILDWIEENYFSPHSDHWGQIAAASKLDWPRVESWLSSGRPLSLVALDALQVIANPASPLLQEIAPELLLAPSREHFIHVLREYAKRDPMPRVTKQVDRLLSA